MKPAPFAYHRAESVAEALDLIAELGDESKFLAGGQSLVPMMNFRLARPSALVDINRLGELRYIRREGDELRIGALTRHREIERPADDRAFAGFGVIPRTARLVGHYPIRVQGTFGGSVAHADPAAEWCLLTTLLDADVVARSRRGERVIPASEFFLGFLTTALEPDEMLVEVRFGRPAPHAAVVEFSRRAGDFAIVAAGVALQREGDLCTSARIALGGVGTKPIRIPAAEAVLAGSRLEPGALTEAGAAAARDIHPPSDIHGDAEYRRSLASVLVQRAAREALSRD
jgi:carbon-monoxide dehydrogenase medium subunit